MPAGTTASLQPVAPPGRAHAPRVVSAAAVALALTAPGQTAAVSVFVDPIIHDLGVSRSAVSTAYLIGSLAGVVVLPYLGRLIDRFGPRRIMAAIAVCFGAILIAGSAAGEIFGLTAAFVGIRVGGQGALNLVATTTVAIYVHRRRGFAIGVSSAIGTAGISLAPMLLERLIAASDWRTVWIWEGVAVWAFVIPAALLLLPRRAPEPSPVPDPAAESPAEQRGPLPLVDWTLAQAARTGMFWAVTSGVAVCALVATGLNFHQQSLLGERGLTATEAAATFLPQTIAGLITSFGLGWLADRFSDRVLIVITMLLLAAATVGAGWVTPGFTAVLYGVALGACGNGIRTLEAVAFPRCFGLRHLGAIRGVVHAITVGASAFGPLLVAIGRDHSTSYRPILFALTALPLVVVLAAVLVRTPPPAPPAPEGRNGQVAVG